MLPEMDGLEVCREVRRQSQLPILMLTAKGDEADRIVGLELGADDYLAKPFNPRELLARIRSVLRRVGPRVPASRRVLVFPRLSIDPEKREVRVRGERVELTSTQFDLLFVLASNAGVVLSRDALMTRARGGRFEAFDRSVDVHISHIRQRIEADPKNPRTIKTVWGEGYVFTGE
jgi:DNA-binding response OmpR family regulator